MYLFVLKIFLYSLIMRTVLLIIFLIFSFQITAYSWEKVHVTDYVNKKTKSPWNFYDDFEDQKVGKVNLKRYQINDKGAGRKPFKIKQESNGNSGVFFRSRIEGTKISAWQVEVAPPKNNSGGIYESLSLIHI